MRPPDEGRVLGEEIDSVAAFEVGSDPAWHSVIGVGHD
jgi:hypothetical protein